MGGGDLNLKKSWHPHTMKNQEKVWKAEQAKSQEEKKLNDLRKEMEEEKNREVLRRIGKESGVLRSNEDDKKLDWMYKSSTERLNREEYLLGRKIDKSFEVLQAEEKEQGNLVGVKQPLNHVEHECVPFSMRAYKNLENSEQVDLQRKVMEDPLMLIKQREMESRRKILENPVKLKELHRILKTDEKLRKVSKKSKKKSKKSKKKHKRRSKSSSNGSSNSVSDADLDSKLAKKLKGGILSKDDGANLGINLDKLLNSKFEKISQELDKAARKGKKRSKEYKRRDDSDTDYSSDRKKNCKSMRSRSSSEKQIFKCRSRSASNGKERRLNRYEQKHQYTDRRNYSSFRSSSRARDQNRKRRSRSFRNVEETSRSLRHSRERNIKYRRDSSRDNRKTNQPTQRPKSRDRKKSIGSRSKSPTPNSSSTKRYQSYGNEKIGTQNSNTLTDEEKQEKLKEMLSNATWREEERTEVVRKHREAYAREQESHTTREFDKNFLNKEIKKAMATQTSVGTRIRSNLNNIQRTSAAMDFNFARK